MLRKALEHPPAPAILSSCDLDRVEHETRDEHDPGDELPATWVVTTPDGLFRCGGRRREHVDVAGGGDVLAAGEVWFAFDPRRKTWIVSRITNRSIGYQIPLAESYQAVGEALAKAGIEHAAGAYDEVYLSATCREHGLQILLDGEALECKICFEPAEAVHPR
jgi:hypothetical protein